MHMTCCALVGCLPEHGPLFHASLELWMLVDRSRVSSLELDEFRKVS